MDAREVSCTTTLRDQTAARLERIVQTAEESRVIEHPVKGGGAEHGIGLLAHRQGGRIGDDQLNPSALPLQMLARDAHHVRRLIDADEASSWQPLEQPFGQPFSSASDI